MEGKLRVTVIATGFQGRGLKGDPAQPRKQEVIKDKGSEVMNSSEWDELKGGRYSNPRANLFTGSRSNSYAEDDLEIPPALRNRHFDAPGSGTKIAEKDA
jgi:hypothetical protein